MGVHEKEELSLKKWNSMWNSFGDNRRNAWEENLECDLHLGLKRNADRTLLVYSIAQHKMRHAQLHKAEKKREQRDGRGGQG